MIRLPSFGPGRATIALLAIAWLLALVPAACADDSQARSDPALPVPAASPTAMLPPVMTVVDELPAPVELAPTATEAPRPSTTAAPTPTPIAQVELGAGGNGAPLVAHRVGQGPLKVVLVGWDSPFPGEVLAAYQTDPAGVPGDISLWVVPNVGRQGSDGVFLDHNADTRFGRCPANAWTPDPAGDAQGSGGPYPFSAAQSQALRQFLADAWLVLFYETGDGLAQAAPDSCRALSTSGALVTTLASRGRYAIVPDLEASGNWVDHLANQGVASARIALPADRDDEPDHLALAAVLANLDDVLGAEAAAGGGAFNWLDAGNAGEWRLAERHLVHPLAIARLGETLYLVDSGRVLALAGDGEQPPRPILSPGDLVAGVPVLEPFDLAVSGEALLVLGRGGDVYRLDLASGDWSLERHVRGIGATSSHYTLGLATAGIERFVVEGSYSTVTRYAPDVDESAWRIPEGRQVDLAADGQAVYLLQALGSEAGGELVRFQVDGAEVSTDRAFRPGVAIERPRQVAAAANGVFVLDRGGTRLLQLDPATGRLLALWQRRDRAAATAVWVDPASGQLLLAGQDRIWFVGDPAQSRVVPAGEAVAERLHDENYLATLGGWLPPIEGTDLPARDLQLPDAPRHYRLGLHEGTDYYWQPGTRVRAPVAGTVIRSLQDYTPPTPAELARWQADSVALGYTTAEALDGYRGRQVWIQHDDGLVTRYAHLRWIAPDIVAGAPVARGQLLGEVGNSGSPASLSSETEDAHLHFEIWLGDQFLGQFLRPVEIREWLQRLFVLP